MNQFSKPLLSTRLLSSHSAPTLAILRESASPWERRAPLSPAHVNRLILQQGQVKLIVQPCSRRAFSDQLYREAGAHVQEDVHCADVILGVKQPAISKLLPHKTYAFFSHTTKGQRQNMPLLQAVLTNHVRLLDYEKLVDQEGRRLVAFGKYAGAAGMVNILHGLGLRLLSLGYNTPFLHIAPPHSYPTIEKACAAVREAGRGIASGATPPAALGPLTFVFTGSGNVSQGAQSVFKHFPHEYVPPHVLAQVAANGRMDKLYACQVSRADYLQTEEGNSKSIFAQKIAPHTRVLVNGIYYGLHSPQLLTTSDLKGAPKLLAVCDISADPGGSLEFVEECTTIDRPFRVYNNNCNGREMKSEASLNCPGILYCSIDNMPTQFPVEATEFFGDKLLPFLQHMIDLSQQRTFKPQNCCKEVGGAVIASDGELTPNFKYMQQFIERTGFSSTSVHKTRKRVLVLGAGHVSQPLVEYLTREGSNLELTVASGVQSEVDKIAQKFREVHGTVCMEVGGGGGSALEGLVRGCDAVVSLLPPAVHPVVARLCIRNKVHMVAPSYASRDLLELEGAAREAGVVLLTEVGLDPGIDHLVAMEAVEDIHREEGSVQSFSSYCGGLPAPECVAPSNPLRHKFSWSPRGALLATLNGAKYLKDGNLVDVSPSSSTEGGGAAIPMDFFPALNLEGFPNRDSLPYKEQYGLGEATSFVRGTLRFRGFWEAISMLQGVGLMDGNPHAMLRRDSDRDITWRQFVQHLIGRQYEGGGNHNADFKEGGRGWEVLEGLGLLEDSVVTKMNNPLDTLCHFLAERLAFGEGERDMVVLHTRLSIRWKQPPWSEIRDVSLVEYGDPRGYSAMAKTVGYTAAIATQLLLQGGIEGVGNVRPFCSPEIYKPLLRGLRREGIQTFTKSTIQPYN